MPNAMPAEDALRARIVDFRQRAEAMGRGQLGVSIYAAPAKPDAVQRYARAGVNRCVFWMPSAGRPEIEQRLDRLAGIVAQYRGAGG